MANLRIVKTKVSDSVTVLAKFNKDLASTINTGNIKITANLVNVPSPEVLDVVVNTNVLIITTQPLTPYAQYTLTCQSTSTSKFRSADGLSFLLEDDVNNTAGILGAEDPADPIRQFLTDILQESVYDLSPGDVARDVLNSQATNLSRGLHDIGQAKNDNYLSRIISNESKTRGVGPYDRLNEEGCYEILKVALSSAPRLLSGNLSFDVFPIGPITLQTVAVTREVLVAGVTAGTFDGLVLTVEHSPVTKLTGVSVQYADGAVYNYNIQTLGYQIQSPRYDQDFASTLVTLADNQFNLNTLVLADPSFRSPEGGDKIFVSYEYKNLGIFVTESSIIVSQLLSAVREVAPPILNKFSLAHAPVVTPNGLVAISDGIQFLDPNANPPFSATHPAFLNELPFRLSSPPSFPGQFMVDYANGVVYVYGATTSDGTGDFPPVMNYDYINSFTNGLDYTYDADTLELVASPIRNLGGQQATITFTYESNLIPFVDFVPQIHTEVLNERAANRVNNTISLTTLHSPITNVFRVFNETLGEVYKVQRWNDNTVFFSTNIPPRVSNVTRERVSFLNVLDETLIVNEQIIDGGMLIFKVELQNDNIIATSEDVIGSSYNSSVTFSRADIFAHELYFDAQVLTVTENLNKLTNIGQYLIDYRSGTIYVAVSHQQTSDIGTVNYKGPVIAPANIHVTSVSAIYDSIDFVDGINKSIPLISFSDDQIVPGFFDISDERFLNNDHTLPYLVIGNTITVADDIGTVRNIFDTYDLNNNTTPTNFAEGVSVSANVITLGNTNKQQTSTIGPGLVVPVNFISPGSNISQVFSVRRVSDSVELFDSSSTFANFDITLSGSTGSPMAGQQVTVIYAVSLNGGATPIVDYSRGDYFIDYTYLLDEILVSYEYGDNVLDFRQSNSVPVGTNYFVTYKVGALRDALLKNFGSLVDLSILNNFDTSLPRETYRDALTSALQCFTKGPTIPAMSSLVSNITHITPQIIEAAFQIWSLGSSYLYPNAINWPDSLSLMSAKFDNGALVTNSGEAITFPISSNLRLEEGTMETWIIPEWDGLDNDATLTFSHVLKSGSLLPSSSIYIGADSHHPTYDANHTFTVNRKDEVSPIGLPSSVFTQTGLFIYYDDIAKRWKVLAKDLAIDGYSYQGTIVSSGEVYDVKFIPGLGEINDVLRSALGQIDFTFNIDPGEGSGFDGYVDGSDTLDGYFPSDGYQPGYAYDGINFMADNEHYIFDYGETDTTNRFSLFKDGRGYLNFRVYDSGNPITRQKNQYKVSADISAWQAGQAHHVAISWKINTTNRRDELHLFIDGFEVPNIMRYGGRPVATSTDRFRTVKPEIIAGVVPLNTVVGADLVTTVNSNVVFATGTNFDDQGIVPGNTIQIRELGFATYTILAVNGSMLMLNGFMPTTLNDARYSVNPFSAVVASEIDLFNNIAVSIIRDGVEIEIPGLRADIPAYTMSVNALNQDVLTILGDAKAGDQIAIRTLGLNHRRFRDRKFVWGDTSNILKTQLPPPINLDEVVIQAVMLPLTSIGPSNSTVVLGVFHATLAPAGQPSNAIEGRTLSIRSTGGNVDFSIPVQVIINGNVTETISFSAPGSQNTVNKFTNISSIQVIAKPLVVTQNSIAIEIKEAYSITYSEGNELYPVIRFSYKTQIGQTMQGTSGSATVTDTNGYFTNSSVGQTLIINSPLAVAGSYIIVSKIDNNTIVLNTPVAASFTNGNYDIFNVSLSRSGFQNGFFVLEQAGQTNVPFTLNQGYYDFDYSVYLHIPMKPVGNGVAYLGADLHGNNQAQAIIDEFVILSNSLTDVRVGESLGHGQESITTDFNKLKPFTAGSNTLMLLHLDSFPLVNSAKFWISAQKDYIQSANSVNGNFGKCLVINDKPLVVDNAGLLTTTSEGTIEFWVSPMFDTYNDPNFRYYFDASGSVVEETISITRGTIKVSNRIGSVLSVRLQTDTNNTGANFFAGGSIASDFQTINLTQALPYQNTPVKVNYVPTGLVGNRISIFKDPQGYINFEVIGNGVTYQVRQPVFWQAGSWHRVMATYKFNRPDNQDQIRLFVDGEERGTVLFGHNILFGPALVFGQGFAGVNNSTLNADINFRDPINQFYIGADYLSTNLALASIDNLRLSDISRMPIFIAGQAIDVNFNSNISLALPVVTDAVTTYLLDFNTLLEQNTNFALLVNEAFGIFNFTLNVIDSFDIVEGNAKVQQVLETLVKALKPAQSIATINYIR